MRNFVCKSKPYQKYLTAVVLKLIVNMILNVTKAQQPSH